MKVTILAVCSDSLKEKLFRVNGPLASHPHGTGNTISKKSDHLDADNFKYHQELHASLQVFQAKRWRPLDHDSIPESSVTRCRPISARPSSSSHRTTFLIPRPPSASRPHSEPINFQPASHADFPEFPRRPDTPRVTHGNYDTLSPRILCHLVTDPRPMTPLSSYGDVIEPVRKARKRRSKKRTTKALALLRGEDINATLCADSDSDVDELNTDDDSEDETSDDESDNESTSELERGVEPSVDRFRQVPNLHLRPEKLDHVYVPDNKRDMRRFDFDAEKVDIPSYDFECPIPPPFNTINFRLHGRENTDWRYTCVNLGPDKPELHSMLDRLVEMEKLQIETEEWEEKKAKMWRGRRPASRNSAPGGSAGFRIKDKRCCSSCLQPACVGDCPNKRTPPPYCCEKCHQLLCRGNCTDTRYDQHQRHKREPQVMSLPPRPPLPKNCRTCQRKHTAKYINANNVVLGRPKSAFATFSRGQSSSKPKDLRPKSAMDIVTSISQKIEKLGIDSIKPPPPPKCSRPSSRNGIIPGKSYFSNLNDSLTDLSCRRRVKSARTRRAKSARSCRSPIENGV